jgi:hypothetical protein
MMLSPGQVKIRLRVCLSRFGGARFKDRRPVLAYFFAPPKLPYKAIDLIELINFAEVRWTARRIGDPGSNTCARQNNGATTPKVSAFSRLDAATVLP